MGNCNNLNNNSKHLPLNQEIVYIFKVALNSLSSTTSKYKAFGITTTKTVVPAHCLQNLQKYKKCLNSYIKSVLPLSALLLLTNPNSVYPAIVYKLHITLTLHNPNTYQQKCLDLVFIYCPCPAPASPTIAGLSTLVLHF